MMIQGIFTFILFFGVSRAVLDKVGYEFEADSALDKDARGVFILDEITFANVTIIGFRAYCTRSERSVWFQVWRPIDQKRRLYSLVGQTKMSTNSVPMYYEKRLYTTADMIFTRPGDVLGLYHELDQSPIAYKFVASSGSGALRAEYSGVSPMPLGTQLSPIDVDFPYRFSVSVQYDTDVTKYLEGGTGTLIPPTIPPTTRDTIPPIPNNIGTIVYLGNPLMSRDSMMTSDARGTVYLLRHLMFKKGTVTSFFGYFVRRAVVYFQVWRLVLDGTQDTYMLVGQSRAQNTFYPTREEFKLDNYIWTEDGDILGIMIEGATNPIGFGWIYEESRQRPLGTRMVDGDSSAAYPGYNLTFSDVTLPQDFAVGAKYDTVIDYGRYGTPPAIVVTTTQTTTMRTTTIPALVERPAIGEENLRYTSRALAIATRKTFVMADTSFPVRALVKSFYAYCVNKGLVKFQVWRLVPGDGRKLRLIGNKDFQCSNAGYTRIPLAGSELIAVEAGDYIGYYNNEPELGCIGYHFEASNLFYNDTYFGFELDGEMEFEQMPYPYKFAIAASYLPTPDETTADPAEPTQGKTQAPIIQPIVDRSKEPFGWLLDSRVLLIMFVWLCVITFLFIVLCGVMLCREQRRYNSRYRQRPSSFTNPVMASRPTSFSRWDDFAPKSNDLMDYLSSPGGAALAGSLDKNTYHVTTPYKSDPKNNNGREGFTHM